MKTQESALSEPSALTHVSALRGTFSWIMPVNIGVQGLYLKLESLARIFPFSENCAKIAPLHMRRFLSIFILLTACSQSKNPQPNFNAFSKQSSASKSIASETAKEKNSEGASQQNTFQIDLLETLPKNSKKICSILNSDGVYVAKIITTDSGLYLGRTTVDHLRSFQGKELLEVGSSVYAYSFNELQVKAWYSNKKRDFRKKITTENPYTIELVSFDEKDPSVKGEVSSLFFIRGECEFLARKDDFRSLVSLLFLIENKNDYSKQISEILTQKNFESKFSIQKERFDLGAHSLNACLIDTYDADKKITASLALLGKDSSNWVLLRNNHKQSYSELTQSLKKSPELYRYQMTTRQKDKVLSNSEFEVKENAKIGLDYEALSVFNLIQESKTVRLRLVGPACLWWFNMGAGEDSWKAFQAFIHTLDDRYPLKMFLETESNF